MLLKDAIFDMKEKDRFKFNDKAINDLIKVRHLQFKWIDHSGADLNIGEFLDLGDQEGEIIPAEPKPMTVNELWKWFWPEDETTTISKSDFNRIVEKCRENFEFSMWLKFKKYMESDKFSSALSLPNAIDKLNPTKETKQ